MSYDNLKQKESEGSKAGEFKASNGWFGNFKKRFSFKIVKITEKTCTDQDTAEVVPAAIKKIIEEKNICLNRFLMQTKVFWRRGDATKCTN